MGDLLLRPIELGPDWLERLSLDVFNKGNKKSEQFSVKQKIKGREADDVNVGGNIWQRNLILFLQLFVFFKKCKSFSSFR